MSLMPHPAPPDAPPGGARHLRRVHAWFNRILTVLFLIAITIPGLGAIWRWDFVGSGTENRALAPFPPMPRSYRMATRLTEQFSRWFTDHFGFRNALIKGLADLRYLTVGAHHTTKVIVGDDGWLFVRMQDIAPGNELSFRLERGLMPFTDAELAQWQQVLEKRHAFLAAHGIPYVVVIPPDKQSIYPEHLPAHLRTTAPTRLDQLIAWLDQKKSPVKIVDLRPALLAAKAQGEIYRRTDSHWNDEGAYVAYRAILEAIRGVLPAGRFARLQPEPRSMFHTQDKGMKGADLSAVLNLENRIQERWLELRRNEPTKALEWQEETDVVQTHLEDPELPTLYLARDSFSTALLPFLKNSFRHIHTPLHHHLEEERIVRAKPDVVVSEFVERKLHYPAPIDSPGIRAWPATPPP